MESKIAFALKIWAILFGCCGVGILFYAIGIKLISNIIRKFLYQPPENLEDIVAFIILIIILAIMLFLTLTLIL